MTAMTALSPPYILLLIAYLVWIFGISLFPLGKTTMVVFTLIIPFILVFYGDYWRLALFCFVVVVMLACGYGKAEGTSNYPIAKPLPVTILTLVVSTVFSLLLLRFLLTNVPNTNLFVTIFVILLTQILSFLFISAIVTYFIGGLFVKKVEQIEGTLVDYRVVRRRKSTTITASFSGSSLTFTLPYIYRFRLKNKIDTLYSYKVYHCVFGLIFIGNIKLLDDSQAKIPSWEAEESKRIGKLLPVLVLLIGFIIVIVASNLFLLLRLK